MRHIKNVRVSQYTTVTRQPLKSSRPMKDVCTRKYRRPNSYYLGSAESPTSDSFSVWLKSSHSGDVASPPCSPQVGSAPRPPSLYGRCLCRTVPARLAKIFSPCQMFAAANISAFFLGKIKNLTRLISVLSLQFKFLHDHKSCPNSAVTLLSL